jgi:hypothetical protein
VKVEGQRPLNMASNLVARQKTVMYLEAKPLEYLKNDNVQGITLQAHLKNKSHM